MQEKVTIFPLACGVLWTKRKMDSFIYPRVQDPPGKINQSILCFFLKIVYVVTPIP